MMKQNFDDDFLKKSLQKHGMEQPSSGFTDALLHRMEKAAALPEPKPALPLMPRYILPVVCLLLGLLSVGLWAAPSATAQSAWGPTLRSWLIAVDWSLFTLPVLVVSGLLLLVLLDRLVASRLLRPSDR
jgi:hypothetical protein